RQQLDNVIDLSPARPPVGVGRIVAMPFHLQTDGPQGRVRQTAVGDVLRGSRRTGHLGIFYLRGLAGGIDRGGGGGERHITIPPGPTTRRRAPYCAAIGTIAAVTSSSRSPRHIPLPARRGCMA